MADPGPNIEPLLIQTKLYRPQAGAGLVERPHLLARLEEGLKRELILVSAPPGSGKTTLASHWLAACDLPSTWLSLDERDNHLPQFLRYVCAAVCRCVPEVCANLLALLGSTALPDTDYLADLLVEELNALPGELILALDDYHHIRSPEVHHVLRQLLRYRPPRLHLVLLTRFDPPLSLGKLRMGQRVTEIRGADLRFGLDETRLLLQERVGQPLDDRVLQSLQARTEGWAIGLQLAALSLAGQTRGQSPDRFLDRFSGSHRLLAGYLVEEVMENLPEAVTEFLTRTALLDRFCAPLGDALLAGSPWEGSAQAAIDHLAAQNLFVVPLDDQDTWFRYHDLFREFLVHRLEVKQGQNALADLHRRAGDWLAQAGLIEDALRHLLAVGDEARAADLVETRFHPMLNQEGPAPVLARWLDLFSEQAIQAHPGLLIAQAYVFAIRWDFAAMAAILDRAAKLVDERPQPAPSPSSSRAQQLALLNGLRGYMFSWQGDTDRAISLLRRALDYLDPVAHSFTYTALSLALVEAYVNCGQLEKALDLLHAALAEATVHRRPAMMLFMGSRAIIHLQAGELDKVADVAERLLALADSPWARSNWSGAGTVRIWRGWAHYFLGTVRYEQNDLEAAAEHWRCVETVPYQVNPGTLHDSLAGLALIAQAQGAPVQALAYAQAAREFAVEQHSPSLLELSETLEARLALSGGLHAENLHLTHEIDATTHQDNPLWLEPTCLTVLRALLAEATPASLTKALGLAETCLRRAEDTHNTRRVIQVAALYALALRALRRTLEALAALERALALAEPRGFVRTFLDLGAPMAELLQLYERRGQRSSGAQGSSERRSSPYTRRLLAAFARELDSVGRDELAAQYVRLYGITPLTQRELELLDLVAQRLTYREIANLLVISPNTVKKHVSNVYGKLGVSSRRQAIAKAQEVGLLSTA